MPKFCPTCGKQLQYENAEICPNCGVRIQSTPPTQSSPNVQNEIRNPWLAVILSFFFCGWGHWYNGRTWDGLKFFGLFLIIYIFTWVLLVIASTATSLAILYLPAFILAILVLGIWIYGMYDAYKTAEKINRGELEFTGKSKLFWLPVVLLIIAVIIIIAAVCAAFVFGMAGNIQKTKVVAATAMRIDANNIVVTYLGGQDAASLQSITISENGVNVREMSIPAGSGLTSLPVGTSVTIAAPSNSNIIGVGKFTDGTSQVIIDTTL